MTLDTFAPGVDTSFSTKLNSNFDKVQTKVVASTPYTGTGFDADVPSGTSNASATNNTTLTVAGGDIENFVRIVPTVSTEWRQSGSVSSSIVSLKIETSEAGAGSWTTRFDRTISGRVATNQAGHGAQIQTIELYYAPTSDEKTNGLDIRFTGTVTCTSAGDSIRGNISNVQTMIYSN
jgi:hypothetical protein